MSTTDAPSTALPKERSRPDLSWLVMGATVLIVAWLALVPLGFLLWQSFSTPISVTEPARFTLDNYRAVYTNPDTIRLLTNSLIFAGGGAALSLTLGTLLAWLNERTDVPFQALLTAIAIVPLVIPGILFVTAWIMLASPKIGIINLVLQQIFGTDAVFVDIYTLPGMIWVDGIQHAPIAFLMMGAAFRNLDPALEESALMSGASLFQTTRRVTLRLARPAAAAAFLILFVRSIESFENPALLGLPANIEVFTSAIYEAIQSFPSDIGLASAYATLLLVIAAAGIAWQARLTRDAARYATVTGKGFRAARAHRLGGWRVAAGGFVMLYAALAIGLPFLVLVWSSLQPFYAVPSLEALKTVSLDNYEAVLRYPGVGIALRNTLILAAASATLVMLLSAVASWMVLRSRLRFRRLIDAAASFPLAIPGLVAGLAIMIAYLALPFPIYGTLWILLIAYMTRFLPYGMRFNSNALLQIHRELEESSGLSGAHWGTTFRRIVLPLLRPGLAAGWLYIVIVSVRELSSSILLYSPGSQVVSVVLWEFWQNGQYVQLSALGVILIVALFAAVLTAQTLGKRFGVRDV